MSFKLLAIGDISAKAGRKAVQSILPDVIATHSPDFVIANTENATHGHSISQTHFADMKAAGIHFATGGNHSFLNTDHLALLQQRDPEIIRPANYRSDTPGVGFKIVNAGMKQIAIINLIGRAFMRDHVACPYTTLKRILREELAGQYFDFAVVDFHAETTSEKYAMFYFAQQFEKVAAVFGTHTHVQTNDARIGDNGVGYISDLGMCGAYRSILGASVEPILKRFTTQMPVKHIYDFAGGLQFNAALFTIDGSSTVQIDPIFIVKDDVYE